MKSRQPQIVYATLKKMYVIHSIMLITLLANHATAQSVGIGTNTPDPAYKLDVAGSAKVNTNLAVLNRIGIGGAGNPTYKLHVDNGASYFDGNTTTTGTASVTGNANIGGTLNLAGSGIVDNNFRVNGRVGIGGATDGNYQLFVHGGPSYFEGNSITLGNSDIVGNLTLSGTGIVGSNFRVNGRIGINGATHGSYELMVNNGDTYLQGNATVTGTVNASGNLTIKGNGHVRSNGGSSLRIGFDQLSMNTSINAGSHVDLTANITSFTGGNSDIRVMISQVVHTTGSSTNSYNLTYKTFAVDATTNTCKVRIYNPTGAGIVLVGTAYLMSVAKD